MCVCVVGFSLACMQLSEERDQLHETLEKMKATLNERVNKVVA